MDNFKKVLDLNLGQFLRRHFDIKFLSCLVSNEHQDARPFFDENTGDVLGHKCHYCGDRSFVD